MSLKAFIITAIIVDFGIAGLVIWGIIGDYIPVKYALIPFVIDYCSRACEHSIKKRIDRDAKQRVF